MRTAFAVALCVFNWVTADAEVPIACLRWNANTNSSMSFDLATMELPAPDYLNVVIGCNPIPGSNGSSLTPPKSEWLDAERASYTSAVVKTTAEVLVVPFQDQGYGLDRIERALMTFDLAYELGVRARVADPQLVARALGDGARRLEPTAVLSLAARLGVRKVVMGYVGHDKHHVMTLTIQVMDLQRGAGGAGSTHTLQRDWRAVPFTDQRPPFAAFHAMLPEVAKNLGMSPAPFGSPAVEHRSGTLDLSGSPSDLVTEGSSKVSASAAISLLGALASSRAELARERLFERAYVLSTRFDPRDARASFLQAYALMNLEHRPAALARIGDSLQPEDVALRAALNGDLPGMEAALKTVSDPYAKTLLSFTIQDMRYDYRHEYSRGETDAAALFGVSNQDWRSLIGSRLADENPWTVDSPEALKILLDHILPAPGLDLNSVTEGSAIIGAANRGFDETTLDIIIARHIRRLVGEITPVACCNAHRTDRVSRWDLLWLLESRAAARLTKEVYRLDSLQGSTKEAMALLDRYEPFFAGQPELTAARVAPAAVLAHDEPKDLRATWSNQMTQSGLRAIYWSPGENRTAFIGLRTMGIAGSETSLLGDAYGFDFPRRSYWPTFYLGSERDKSHTLAELAKESLEYSRVDLEPAVNLVQYTEEERRQIYADLQSRFLGAPGRTAKLASLRPKGDASFNKREELSAEIAAEPETFYPYYSLAQLLISTDGDYQEAHKILLSYPRFRGIDHPANAVQLSNEAYKSGSLFYLYGQAELSKDLYKIASDLDTGSDASMASTIRLQLLAGNLRAAMVGSLERAARYPNAYAYRDYLSLLHVMGNSVQAWQGFSQVASAFDVPQVWLSALVGHRFESRSESYVREWLHRAEIRNARFNSKQFAPAFAILWNSTDRMPPLDLDRLVESLEDGTPPAPSWPTLKPGRFALAYFGAAYSELRHGRWAKSAGVFKEMAEHYPLYAGEESFALPYFAMAATKIGDKWLPELLAEESHIEGDFARDGTYDRLLARAVIAGAEKDANAAQALLRSAFNIRPNTEHRPILTEYEYAQVCEWLYRETRDPRFAEMLLGWTEEYEKIQPTHAWAYAMEYAFAKPGERRVRALAMTLYLDPSSERIKRVPNDEVVRAREWLARNNPFRNDDSRSSRTASGRSRSSLSGPIRFP